VSLSVFSASIFLLTLVLTPGSARAQDAGEPPFGVNNAFAASQDSTATWLADLGVTWISDHLPRREIEKVNEDGEVRYEFAEVLGSLLTEYGTKRGANAWFVVKSQHLLTDGQLITDGPSKGKYVPSGPVSLAAYAAFLEELVLWVNGQVPGWKVRYWSVDNEHASLYLPAFCGATVEPVCAQVAAAAYANLVERSAQVIRALDPATKIVFGGIGGGTTDQEMGLYYREALLALKAKHVDGYFDFFDYHDFNSFNKYETTSRKRDVAFFRALLTETGFPSKPILVKAGSTHSGMNLASPNRRLRKYQSERQQAEYLLKRFVHHAGHGVRLTLWGTIREDENGEEDGVEEIYEQNGLLYNGLTANDTCDPGVELPCPDPGDGVPKLSYFVLKHLMEKGGAFDWQTIETLSDGHRRIHAYRVRRPGSQTSAIIVWWDYYAQDVPTKTVKFSGLTAASVTFTELIPAVGTGAEVVTYATAFAKTVAPVVNGTVTLTLGPMPLILEE
jgi:hypothetical protein